MKNSANFRHFLSLFFKHKGSIISVFLVTMITVTVGTFLLTPVYEASSTLLIRFGREYVYQPEVGNRGPSKYFNRGDIINTEIEIFTSRDLQEKLINSVGIDKLYPKLVEAPPENTPLMDAAVEQFTKDLTVAGSKDSNIIHVSFQHTNPKTATTTVNRLVDLYQEKHLQTFSNPKASTFLKEKVDYYRNRIAVLEGKIDTFREKNSTASIKEQQVLLMKQRAELSVNFKQTQSHIASIQERLSSLKGQIESMPETIVLYTDTHKNEIIDKAKDELLSLQMKEKELQEILGAKNPKLISLRNKIETVENFLKEQGEGVKANVRVGENNVYQEVAKGIVQAKADLRSQQAKSTILEKQLKELDGELQTLAQSEQALRDINRELETTEQNYQTYQKKLEETQISNEMDTQKMTNIRVVQAATVPVKPIKPKKRINFAIGILLGTVAGFGLAFFKEYINQGFNSRESVERYLGLPVLATISYRENKNKSYHNGKIIFFRYKKLYEKAKNIWINSLQRQSQN